MAITDVLLDLTSVQELLDTVKCTLSACLNTLASDARAEEVLARRILEALHKVNHLIHHDLFVEIPSQVLKRNEAALCFQLFNRLLLCRNIQLHDAGANEGAVTLDVNEACRIRCTDREDADVLLYPERRRAKFLYSIQDTARTVVLLASNVGLIQNNEDV